MSRNTVKSPDPCVKCGESMWMDPRFAAYPRERLQWKCSMCGFMVETLCLDAQPQPERVLCTDPEMPEMGPVWTTVKPKEMPLDGTNPIAESAYCHHRHHPNTDEEITTGYVEGEYVGPTKVHTSDFLTCLHYICVNARKMVIGATT